METSGLEERKLREIEHSRQRRGVLQGFERQADTHASRQADNLEALIRDQEAFQKHFSNMKFYAVTGASERYYQNWLRKRCRGKKVLDYCCGSGENAIFAARCGAHSTGVDISPEGIENARLNARDERLEDNADFVVGDAENLEFDDDSFDIVICYGALHHLDFDAAMRELRRVIRDDGEIICIESLRHNPFFHMYRRRTPHLRTAWEVEHILGVENLDMARRYFHRVDARFFHLSVLMAVPLRKTKAFGPLVSLLDRIDGALLKRRFPGKYAWMMVFTLAGPNRGSQETSEAQDD